mmetsp:Transcript_7825/g.19170  ORF Transcript_7825/g.19170 Transcript_7825/m.19170 type:complete len:303 (-) Transcript_7825:344-1252(-)
MHDGNESFQKGKGRIKSEQEQIEKDQSDPMDTTDFVEDDGPSSKNETESSVIQVGHCNSFKKGEMAKRRKNGETSDETKHGICERHDAGIGNGGFTAWAMTSKGCQDTKGQSDRKEDLTASHTPYFSLLGQDRHIPDSNVFLDASAGSLESQSLDQEDKEEDDRESHGEICDTSRPLDTPGDTEKDENPCHEGIKDVDSDEASGFTIVPKRSRTNNFTDEVTDSGSAIQLGVVPGGICPEGVKEAIHHPSDQDDVVGVEHESASDGSKSDSSQSGMESSKDSDISGLKVLAESNFKNGKGDS